MAKTEFMGKVEGEIVRLTPRGKLVAQVMKNGKKFIIPSTVTQDLNLMFKQGDLCWIQVYKYNERMIPFFTKNYELPLASRKALATALLGSVKKNLEKPKPLPSVVWNERTGMLTVRL